MALLKAVTHDSSGSSFGGGFQRSGTLTQALNENNKHFGARKMKDNQNGRVTIVKKLQKYSEIILGSD